jgi:hypothetical protein
MKKLRIVTLGLASAHRGKSAGVAYRPSDPPPETPRHDSQLLHRCRWAVCDGGETGAALVAEAKTEASALWSSGWMTPGQVVVANEARTELQVSFVGDALSLPGDAKILQGDVRAYWVTLYLCCRRSSSGATRCCGSRAPAPRSSARRCRRWTPSSTPSAGASAPHCCRLGLGHSSYTPRREISTAQR